MFVHTQDTENEQHGPISPTCLALVGHNTQIWMAVMTQLCVCIRSACHVSLHLCRHVVFITLILPACLLEHWKCSGHLHDVYTENNLHNMCTANLRWSCHFTSSFLLLNIDFLFHHVSWFGNLDQGQDQLNFICRYYVAWIKKSDRTVDIVRGIWKGLKNPHNIFHPVHSMNPFHHLSI